MCNAQPGDFFRVTQLRRSRQKFSRKFMEERNIDEGEIVQIDEVWDKGYLRAQRLRAPPPTPENGTLIISSGRCPTKCISQRCITMKASCIG